MAIDYDNDGPDMAWFELADLLEDVEDDQPYCPVCGGTRLVTREEEDRDTGYRSTVVWCLDCDDLGE